MQVQEEKEKEEGLFKTNVVKASLLATPEWIGPLAFFHRSPWSDTGSLAQNPFNHNDGIEGLFYLRTAS